MRFPNGRNLLHVPRLIAAADTLRAANGRDAFGCLL